MKFYDETKALHIETGDSGVKLGATLVQTRSHNSCPRTEAVDNSIFRSNAFTRKALLEDKKRYSNTEREALVLLYRLSKFHHYSFVREMSIIKDHKLLVAIFKKDASTLSWRLERIILRIHQHRVTIIWKPWPDLFIEDWLSRQNHSANNVKEIPNMWLDINAIQKVTNIPECMTIL